MVGGALGDEPQRVTWQPTSSGSCENCNLIGRQMPSWMLSGARYSGANLSYSSLHSVIADEADFNNITARSADFSRAELSNAKFSGAILSNARLTGAIANGADFSDATLDHCDVGEARLIGANLSGVFAHHMIGRDTDFSAASADGAQFDYAELRGAVFDGALLSDASFAEANLAGASFRDARLAGAILDSAVNIESADFSGACRSGTTALPTGLDLPLCSELRRLEDVRLLAGAQ